MALLPVHLGAPTPLLSLLYATWMQLLMALASVRLVACTRVQLPRVRMCPGRTLMLPVALAMPQTRPLTPTVSRRTRVLGLTVKTTAPMVAHIRPQTPMASLTLKM